MADIGMPKRRIVVQPETAPVHIPTEPARTPAPVRTPVESPQVPEPVPA